MKGYVRGFDVRTGKRLWIFHTIPLPNEYGNDTWVKESWAYTGNTGVWGQISVDENLGLVYLPVELPTGDYFGGDRPGNGLFGESLVAVDLETGKRKWHYQLVHHGLWDMDIPCAPILADITINGRTVKAVAQPTKQAFLYVFNRETGEPIWPMEERPVPQGDVPGEWYSPTQPFPTKPPAFDNQGVSGDSLINFTPELHAEAEKLVSKYKIGPLFTPPSVSKADGPLATIVSPGALGGANWPGGSYDPDTHILYVYSRSDISALGLVPSPDPKLSDMEYVQGTAGIYPHAGQAHGRATRPGPESGEWRTGVDRPRIAAVEAALRPHHSNQSGQGRNRLAGRARRNAGQRSKQSRARRLDDSAHGKRKLDRHADDQDSGHRRRRRECNDAIRNARRDAARLRQGDRQGRRSSLHARAAKRFADDVHAERAAIHCRRHQRPGLPRRIDRVPPAAELSSTDFSLWVSVICKPSRNPPTG